MTGYQPKLLKNPDRKPIASGPVFEFGPGWGAKTKKWFKKYILGGKCALCRATRYILLFGAVILLFGGPQLQKWVGTHREARPLIGQIKVAETVQAGDSKIKLARRALASYLAQFPDPALSNGQKVFIEDTLRHNLKESLEPGTNVEFSIQDIQSAISQAHALAPSTLAKWEEYAKFVRF